MLFRFLILLGLVSWTLHAHPHVFIDTKLQVSAEKIWVLWSFDEMTSSMLMQDYDKNKDKKLDPKEVAFMKKDHFDTLMTYSYFMHFSTGEEEKNISKPLDFIATYERGKLHYLFSIATPKLKNYEFRFYDGEMYVAMILKQEYLECTLPFTCKVQGYDADFYYGYKVVISQ